MDGRPLQKALNHRMGISVQGLPLLLVPSANSRQTSIPQVPCQEALHCSLNRSMAWMLKDPTEPHGERRE